MSKRNPFEEEFLTDPETFEDELTYSEDEDLLLEVITQIVGDPAPTTEEMNDMYYYFNSTHDDPIRMCEVEDRYDR